MANSGILLVQSLGNVYCVGCCHVDKALFYEGLLMAKPGKALGVVSKRYDF